MSRKYFGTDGIRGTANTPPMTPEIALRVGMAAARQFMRGSHRHRVVIGKDTRLSGYMLEPALTAGFISMGMDVVLVGPMPTPAIGMLTRSLRGDLGVMISASHNPYHDNGLKLFGPDGYKLSDAVEQEIESRLEDGFQHELAAPDKLGRARRLEDAQGRYIEFVKNTFPRGLRLDGCKVVIDCANGSGYHVAPPVLFELGAEVVSIGVKPDGFNINRGCGSTDTKLMRQAVIENDADIGIALDGDADRVVIADESGAIVDGDQIMALIADDWHREGRLRGGVVATVMSNLGFERYLTGRGIQVARTRVGDRYVVECMRANEYNLGGEQSGHIIMSDYSTTGDGLIAALQVLAVKAATGRRASEFCRVFDPLPQRLKNVHYNGAKPLANPLVQRAVREVEDRLGAHGRLLIRESGTEPVIRVMVEAEDEALMNTALDEIVAVIEKTAA